MSNITFFHIATVTPDWEPYDKSAFPPAVHHRPVATSMVTVGSSDYVVGPIVSRSITDIEQIEQEGATLLADLFQDLVESGPEYIVTFSGLSFVRPVLGYAALHYGIVNPLLSPSLNPKLRDISTMMTRCGFGEDKYFSSLSDYAVLIGLNKRPFLDVAKAFQGGDVDTISARLELDVMLIAALYFRLMLCTDQLPGDLYRRSVKQLLRAYYTKSKFIRDYMTKQDVMQHLQIG